jgi:hypothetical protein
MGLAYGAYYLYTKEWSDDKLDKKKKVKFMARKKPKHHRHESKTVDSETEPIEPETVGEALVTTDVWQNKRGGKMPCDTVSTVHKIDMNSEEFKKYLDAQNDLIARQQDQFAELFKQLVEPEAGDYLPRKRHQNQYKKSGRRERKLKLRRKLTPEEYEEWQKRKAEAYAKILHDEGDPQDWGDAAELDDRASKAAWKSWWSDHDQSDYYIEDVNQDWDTRARVAGRARFESHSKTKEPSVWIPGPSVFGQLDEAKQSLAKVREAPPPPKKKKEVKEPAPAIKKSMKGKEKEVDFSAPCPRKGCTGVFFHPSTGKKDTCKYQHARKESLVPGSPVLPKSVARSKHAVLSKKGPDDKWFKNANVVYCGSRAVTCQHAHDPGIAVDLENSEGAHALVQMKQYNKLDLATSPKPPGSGASYKMATPKIGEEVWVVGWDCDSEPPTWHESVGHVEELQSPYLAIEGALCHTATTKPTLSGAAVINRQGQLVGWHEAGNDVSAPRNAFIAVTSQMIVDFGTTGSSATH